MNEMAEMVKTQQIAGMLNALHAIRAAYSLYGSDAGRMADMAMEALKEYDTLNSILLPAGALMGRIADTDAS